MLCTFIHLLINQVATRSLPVAGLHGLDMDTILVQSRVLRYDWSGVSFTFSSQESDKARTLKSSLLLLFQDQLLQEYRQQLLVLRNYGDCKIALYTSRQ